MNRSIVEVARVVLVIFALAVWTVSGAPEICAQTSVEQQQQQKKEKKEKKEKKKAAEQKQTKQDDKAKKKGEPAAGVNKMHDSFKKNQGPAKDDADSLRKSTNDAWDKAK
jgi:hypothetical protein